MKSSPLFHIIFTYTADYIEWEAQNEKYTSNTELNLTDTIDLFRMYAQIDTFTFWPES